jgi:hypothetical protein
MSVEGSTFYGRIEGLIDSVGDGSLVGKVEFDQAYAHRQHEELGWKHPHGGRAQYLSTALYQDLYGFMERIADHALQEGGPRLGMIISMERLANDAAGMAPFEIGTLRGSAHPSVEEHDVVVYDRPPVIPRLPDEVLDRLHDMVSDLTQPDVTKPRKRGRGSKLP